MQLWSYERVVAQSLVNFHDNIRACHINKKKFSNVICNLDSYICKWIVIWLVTFENNCNGNRNSIEVFEQVILI